MLSAYFRYPHVERGTYYGEEDSKQDVILGRMLIYIRAARLE
jgi:hypothetical protein